MTSIRKFQRILRAEFPGSTVEKTAGNHIRIRLRNGRFVVTAATPGGDPTRLLHNIRATVRKEMRVG